MKNELFNIKIKRTVYLFIIAFLTVVLLIWFIPNKIFPISWDFRNNLWGPAYLLVHQRSPYNIITIFKSSNAIWMPVLIGLLFPIGYLPLQWASNLWLLLNLIALCLIVIISARNLSQSVIWILLTIISLAIFPPTMTLLALGQVSLIICLVLFILAKYRNILNPIVIGFLLACSLAKPQLIVLFLPAFLIIYFREQRKKFWRAIMYTILGIILFCLPLFLFFPNWIPDFLHNLSVNPIWLYPSLYSFLISRLGSFEISLILAGIWLIIGISISVFLTYKWDGLESLVWSLALTPLFSPVIWSWDFVLFYPLIIFMIFQKKTKASSLALYCGYGICTITFIVMKINGLVGEQMTFWVPSFLITLLYLSRTLQTKNLSGVLPYTGGIVNKK
jgi:hypothetical protein